VSANTALLPALFVIVGGGAGALSRYITASIINNIFKTFVAAGTLTVNIVGSFFIGLLFAIFEKHNISAEFRLFLITGFLGAYTTFSSYSLETVCSLINGNIKLAMINIFVSNVVCLTFTLLGMKLGNKF
jgi:CrcB protein